MGRSIEKTRGHRRLLAVAGVVALVAVACKPAITGSTLGPLGFETTDTPAYGAGSINGQHGWTSAAAYDQEVATAADSGSTPGNYGFGDQSFRISDAFQSGMFDQPLSPQTTDQSGETDASNNGDAAGDTHGFFQADWAFADAGNPNALQTGLHVTVSPESGSGATAGARMSFVSLDDCGATARPDPDEESADAYECDGTTAGLQVNFQGWDHTLGQFVIEHVASGLSRYAPHTIRMRMWFFEGEDNDVVETCVDTTQCVTGHSWENFYRDGGNGPGQLNTSRVDRLLFRLHDGSQGDDPRPSHDNNGFFIDNLSLASQNYTGAAFSVSGPSSVPEGNAGSTNATFTITLSDPLPFQTSVDYATQDDTATTADNDYGLTTGTAIFAPGQLTSQVNVPINGDTTDESHEKFKLKLSNPTSTGLASGVESFGPYAAIDVASKTTTINDDDSTVSVSDGSVFEGNSDTVPMAFTVTLANPSSVPVTVHFQTQNGSAVAPGDYVALSTNVTFNPGQVTKTVNVSVKGDVTLEADENFIVNLSAPMNAALGDSVGAGIIKNDD